MSPASAAVIVGAMWLGCLLPGPWWLAVVGLGVLGVSGLVAGGRPAAALALAAVAFVLVGAGCAGGRLAVAETGPLTVQAAVEGVTDIEAVVVTEARPTSRGAWQLVRVSAVDGRPARQRALVYHDEIERAPDLGARIAVRARVSPLGEDGFHRHLRRLGATAVLSHHRLELTGRPPGVLAASTTVRERTREAFLAGLDAPRAVLLAGLVTGDVRGRPPGQREQLARAGLSHLVVVSGKHTALMLAGVLGLSAVAGLGARGRRVAALAALAWFVVLVRWQPSVLRAGAVATLVLVAGLLGRAHRTVRVLAFAVLGLLLAQPLLAARLGFVLSVLATAGVVLIAPRLVARLRGPRWLRWTGAATLGAQIGVAPVLLATDGAVPLAAVPANLVAGPAAAVGQAVGLVAAALAQVAPAAGAALARVAGPALSAVLWAAQAFADLPPLQPRHLLSPAAALVALAVALRRRPARAAGALALAVTLAAVAVLRPPEEVAHLTVTAVDVGQGDALLVEAPAPGGTARLLFDGGPEPAPVLGFLRERRIRRLDVVVVSHGHADHTAGLPAVLDAVEVAALVLAAPGSAPRRSAPEPAEDTVGELLAAAGRRGVAVRTVAAGHGFDLGHAKVAVLGPPRGGLAAGGLNDRSVVLRVSGAHGGLLLTGDAEQQAQRRLLRAPGRLRVDVVQVPHHGAATNAQGFLQATGASLALLSVGQDNPHGHPRAETLTSLASMQLHRTDQDGTVRVRLGPGGPRALPRTTARQAARCRQPRGPHARRPRPPRRLTALDLPEGSCSSPAW